MIELPAIARASLEYRVMLEKVVWISFWVTLAYWLGGALGCAGSGGQDQNYRVLEDDRELFDTEPHEDVDPGPASALEPPAVRDPVEPQGPHQAPPNAPLAARYALLVGETEAPAVATVSASGSGPSLLGVDRSHWEKTTIGPAIGDTEHLPTYFQDRGLWEPQPNPTTVMNDPDADPDTWLNAALDNPKAGSWSGSNAGGLVVQPVKFSFDVVTLPIRMLFKPPWTTERTVPGRQVRTSPWREEQHDLARPGAEAIDVSESRLQRRDHHRYDLRYDGAPQPTRRRHSTHRP